MHRHWRADDGSWHDETVVGDGTIPIPCPAGGVVTLAEIYEDVELPSVPPAPRLRRVYERPLAAPGHEPIPTPV